MLNTSEPQIRRTRITTLVCFLLVFLLVQVAGLATAASPPDPGRFEKAIAAFEAQDREAAPASDSIVFVGSSSIRMWHESLAEDMAPLRVVPRGFGGSTMPDALHFVDRIVTNYRPRAVVLYEGDNDIGSYGLDAAAVAEGFGRFVERIHDTLPGTRIYFLSIKPSIARWSHWPEMARANQIIQGLCDADPALTYVDVATPMLDASGQPRPELFVSDDLHMTRAGYDVWTEVVRSVLLPAELDHE